MKTDRFTIDDFNMLLILIDILEEIEGMRYTIVKADEPDGVVWHIALSEPIELDDEE